MNSSNIEINGFSLVELLVVIIALGIVAAVGTQWMGASIDDYRRVTTEREMKILASAIVGDPELQNNGRRCDFGYVGDIGAFPTNLDALHHNPGAFATWDGPYLPAGFMEDTTGYKIDEWGQAYTYNGGITISSTGGGVTITEKIADAPSDYLLNRLTGMIKDADDSLPGGIYCDSIDIIIDIPDGAGATISKNYNPDSAGVFTLDSLPVGTHPVKIVYSPANDTLRRFVTILPRHKSDVEYKFASAYFTSGAVSCDSSGILILRPDGDGSITELSRSGGCGSNWECVDDISPDDNSTRVRTTIDEFQTDVYDLPDPGPGTCRISKITVYGRAQKTTLFMLDYIRLVLLIGGTEYESPRQSVSNSYVDYNYEWANNPATGLEWTWSDINNLEIGISLYTESPIFRINCTQVWVEVEFNP